MRVDLTTYGVEPPENNKTGRTSQSGASGTAASSASGLGQTGRSQSDDATGLDQTSFSFDQARVQSLAAEVMAQPEIRTAKVQSLQTAIGNGEYSVPPSLVAEAMAGELSGAAG
jgi:flagellar biosynthesis anti-sigma factor FlgM